MSAPLERGGDGLFAVKTDLKCYRALNTAKIAHALVIVVIPGLCAVAFGGVVNANYPLKGFIMLTG